jgi:predicted nucleic acid-binding protein
MVTYFFDSSALVKRYHQEIGTDVINRMIDDPDSRRFIARLAVIEVQSAFARRVREKAISVADFDIVRQRFLDDIGQRRFHVVRMTDEHYHTAERLIRQYGPQPGQLRLRTLDALQLAVALAVHQHTPLDSFVTADDNQGSAARAEQLTVLNPAQA